MSVSGQTRSATKSLRYNIFWDCYYSRDLDRENTSGLLLCVSAGSVRVVWTGGASVGRMDVGGLGGCTPRESDISHRASRLRKDSLIYRRLDHGDMLLV